MATYELAFTTAPVRMQNADGVMGVFNRSVLSISSGKILDKKIVNLCMVANVSLVL